MRQPLKVIHGFTVFRFTRVERGNHEGRVQEDFAWNVEVGVLEAVHAPWQSRTAATYLDRPVLLAVVFVTNRPVTALRVDTRLVAWVTVAFRFPALTLGCAVRSVF